jgi:GntR family transcriptional regulator
VSRITVRKALDGLVEEGLLVRRQGSGNFVAARIEKNFAKLTSFSEDMRSRGRTPKSVWLKRAEGQVTPEEALTLRLSPGAKVYRFHRLRYADDAPMCLEFATIAAFALPSLDAVDRVPLRGARARGQPPGAGAATPARAAAFSEHARLLHARPGDAGLLVERIGFLRDGPRRRVLPELLPCDTYDFIASSRRPVSKRGAATTRMFREAAEAPAAVRRQLAPTASASALLGERLRSLGPRAVVTCARGSSDHAATYAKYLMETRSACSPPRRRPSVSSVYRSRQDRPTASSLAISQSGRSPDLPSPRAPRARGGGAFVVAPRERRRLAARGDRRRDAAVVRGPRRPAWRRPSRTSPRSPRSAAGGRVSDDAKLGPRLTQAPRSSGWRGTSTDAGGRRCSWRDQPLRDRRGVGLAVAQEAALSQGNRGALHAEAFSGAEVRHGPQALLGASFPALVLAQDDAAPRRPRGAGRGPGRARRSGGLRRGARLRRHRAAHDHLRARAGAPAARAELLPARQRRRPRARPRSRRAAAPVQGHETQ